MQASEEEIRANLRFKRYGADKVPYVEMYLRRLELERDEAAKGRREGIEGARDDRTHRRTWLIFGFGLAASATLAFITQCTKSP